MIKVTTPNGHLINHCFLISAAETVHSQLFLIRSILPEKSITLTTLEERSLSVPHMHVQ